MEREQQIEEMPNKLAYTSERQMIREYCHRIREAVNYKGNNDHEDVPSILWDFKEEVIAGYRKVDTGVTIYMNGESELTKAFNEAFALAPQLGWISVEDRMPQENEKVLAINSDGEIFIATYLMHKVSPSARGYMTWASGLWNGIPTHWRPLPTPPKMKGAE